MGSRQSQPMGLCPGVEEYLQARLENYHRVTGKRHVVEVDWESQTTTSFSETLTQPLYHEEVWAYCGMFDDVPLRRWVFTHGTAIEEHVQWSYWDAGPIEFMALKEDGVWLDGTLWTPGWVKVQLGLELPPPPDELDPRKRDAPGPVAQ